MMAAIQAATCSEVVLLEKNSTLGKKLLLSGGGRCNLTSALDETMFLEKIDDARFFRPAWRAFSNHDLLSFFESRGLHVKKEGFKYYPETDSARSVLQVLMEAMREKGVHWHTHAEVHALDLQAEAFRVSSTQGVFPCERLIIACGGASYPATGSDGQMHRLLQKSGISVTDLQAGLAALYAQDVLNTLSGITLPDVALHYGKKKVRGELLFTHHGISGPLALDLSSELMDFPLELELDFLPGSSEAELLQLLFHPERRSLSSILAEDLPKRVAQVLMQGYDQEDRFNFTRQKRRALIDRIKHYPLKIDYKGSLRQAMVTVGGVDLKEISSRSLEHKRIKGLYLAGEILDLHGATGGYNLQIAFSTGYLAGTSICMESSSLRLPKKKDKKVRTSQSTQKMDPR